MQQFLQGFVEYELSGRF